MRYRLRVVRAARPKPGCGGVPVRINTDQGIPDQKKKLSVSKIECAATVRGKGKFTVDFYRHLAPATVAALLGEFPLSSRVMLYPGAMVTLLTKLKIGVEKQRLEFSKEDVAVLAANGSICIFLANVKSERP